LHRIALPSGGDGLGKSRGYLIITGARKYITALGARLWLCDILRICHHTFFFFARFAIMTTEVPFNIAKAVGIDSFALALIFCIIYIPLFLCFIIKWVKNPVYVLGAAALFCIGVYLYFFGDCQELIEFFQVRVTAFGLRAVLTKSLSLAENRNMIIAESVIYGIGFLGILSGAYNLVLDRCVLFFFDWCQYLTPWYREDAAGTKNPDPLRIVTGNRHIMRMIMSGAVVMGILGAVDSLDPSNTPNTIKMGTHLRKLSVIVFLVVCLLLVMHTSLSVFAESKSSAGKRKGIPAFSDFGANQGNSDEKTYAHSFGHTHGMKILLITALFLSLREIFYVATMNNLRIQEEERFFYPFAAGTELIAVLTLLIPQLVPPKHELPQ
jgi:hypothetical protein